MPSAAAAARGRTRGPSVLQRRAAEEAAAQKAASERLQQRASRKRLCDEDPEELGSSAASEDSEVRGRVRLHAAAREVNDCDRAQSLSSKGKWRRTVTVHALGPSGAADFDEAPSRPDFDQGDAGGDLHEQAFLEYVDGNFDDAGSEVRHLDQRDAHERDRRVGLFGDWLEAAGHGTFTEWQKDPETGYYRLALLRDDAGQPKVMRAVSIMEFALKVRCCALGRR